MTAVVFDSGSSVLIGGLTQAERAVLLASRLGLKTVVRRARKADGPPLAAVDDACVVVAPDVLFGPSALAALVEHAVAEPNIAVVVGAPPLLLYVPQQAGTRLDQDWTFDALVRHVRSVTAVDLGGLPRHFARVVDRADQVASATADYVRHLNGKGEAYFTKKIRRFSVPLTCRLAPVGVRPAHVTLAGLVLAVASAWALAQGAYLTGLVGAVLYYASMVCDCSDGEIARLTVRDSAFGAWFETVVDYSTYFLLLAALFAASQTRPEAGAYRAAVLIAAVGSVVVIAIMSDLRRRVAGGDPGEFDSASARELATSTRVHRFARWGRQWIKRSTMAHLIVFFAVINQLPWLLFLWAFGATVALGVLVIVLPFVVRRVSVPGPVQSRAAGSTAGRR
jgi:phosphatidylglycerophosphate synthase